MRASGWEKSATNTWVLLLGKRLQRTLIHVWTGQGHGRRSCIYGSEKVTADACAVNVGKSSRSTPISSVMVNTRFVGHGRHMSCCSHAFQQILVYHWSQSTSLSLLTRIPTSPGVLLVTVDSPLPAHTFQQTLVYHWSQLTPVSPPTYFPTNLGISLVMVDAPLAAHAFQQIPEYL